MDALSTAVGLAKDSLGVETEDYDAIFYEQVSETSWLISFFLLGLLVGSATVEVD